MKNLTQHQTNVDEILKHPKQSVTEKFAHWVLQKKIAGAVFLTSLILKTKQVCATPVSSGIIMEPLRYDRINVYGIILRLWAFLLAVTLLGKLFKKMSFFWFLSVLTFLAALLLMGFVVDYISATYFLENPYWYDDTLDYAFGIETPTQRHIRYLPFFNGLSIVFCITALLIWCIPFLSFIFYKFKKINLERFNNILNVWVKALICSALMLVIFLIIKEKYFYALLYLILGYLMLKKLPLQQKLIVANTLLTGCALFWLSDLMNMGLAYLFLSSTSLIPCIQSIKSLENQTEKKKKFAYSVQLILTTCWAIFVFFNFLISTFLNA